MPDQEYRRAIDLSRKIAAEVGTPRFYLEREREVALSRELVRRRTARRRRHSGSSEERGDYLGHGLIHVRKVAIDVGALILIEEGGGLPDARVRRLVLLAHLAGLLHDIRRAEKDHAERGADEAAETSDLLPDSAMMNAQASPAPSGTMRPSGPFAPMPVPRRGSSPTPSTMRTNSVGDRTTSRKPSGR